MAQYRRIYTGQLHLTHSFSFPSLIAIIEVESTWLADVSFQTSPPDKKSNQSFPGSCKIEGRNNRLETYFRPIFRRALMSHWAVFKLENAPSPTEILVWHRLPPLSLPGRQVLLLSCLHWQFSASLSTYMELSPGQIHHHSQAEPFKLFPELALCFWHPCKVK